MFLFSYGNLIKKGYLTKGNVMLPLWAPRRKTSFSALILLCLIWITNSYAAIPPAPPSLSGNKTGSTVGLHWDIDCKVTAVNIQESTDGNAWSTAYSGLGLPDDVVNPPILMALSFGGGGYSLPRLEAPSLYQSIRQDTYRLSLPY